MIWVAMGLKLRCEALIRSKAFIQTKRKTMKNLGKHKRNCQI